MIYTLKYTENIPGEVEAETRCWWIHMRPSCEGDVGQLEHEKVHVAQFWRNPLRPFLLLLSKSYVLKTELEGYRKQMEYPPWSNSKHGYILDDFAPSISRQTGYPVGEIVKALEG
jgi:hypothetical protein